MSTNNKKYRLSLQFNSLDPTQAEAVKILKQMGHKKSLFIANAVLYYASDESSFVTGMLHNMAGGFGLVTPLYSDFIGSK